jgi:hypothetical protein
MKISGSILGGRFRLEWVAGSTASVFAAWSGLRAQEVEAELRLQLWALDSAESSGAARGRTTLDELSARSLWAGSPVSETGVGSLTSQDRDLEFNAGRVRTFLSVPETGDYTLLVSGDDQVELWLSADENAGGRDLVAKAIRWGTVGEWDREHSQMWAQKVH